MEWDGSEDSSEGSHSGGAMDRCLLCCSQGQCGRGVVVTKPQACHSSRRRRNAEHLHLPPPPLPPPPPTRRSQLCAADSNVSDADAAALGMDTQPPEFYDEEADERNEAWVQKMRRWVAEAGYVHSRRRSSPPPPLPLHAFPVPAPARELATSEAAAI